MPTHGLSAYGYRLAEIAGHLAVRAATVSRPLKQASRKICECRDLEEELGTQQWKRQDGGSSF